MLSSANQAPGMLLMVIQTFNRDALEEIDRLGPDADLVQYHFPSCPEATMKKPFFPTKDDLQNANHITGCVQILLPHSIRSQVMERNEHLDTPPSSSKHRAI